MSGTAKKLGSEVGIKVALRCSHTCHESYVYNSQKSSRRRCVSDRPTFHRPLSRSVNIGVGQVLLELHVLMKLTKSNALR